ncbi:hypothetical protein D3C75_883270 [compost metagenome]
MDVFIERLTAALNNMQHDFLHNLNELLVYLGNQLLILFLLLLVAENKHLLYGGQIDFVTAFTVKPDSLANHDDLGILGVLGNNYIVIENFGHCYAAQYRHLF